jgi:hypothetical protein
MDLFDPFAFVPLPGERGLGRRPRNEQAATGTAILGLPLIEAAITVVAHVKDPVVLCLALPLAFGALAYLACRLLRARVGYSVGAALRCAAMCFCWGVVAVVITVMTWGY